MVHNAMDSLIESGRREQKDLWSRKEGFVEDDKGFHLSIAIPGFEKDNITVQIDPESRYLGLKAADDAGNTEAKHLIIVPRHADVSKNPKAVLKNGILTVSFEKDTSVAPRTIEVTVQ
tara:strand:+ start:975 stop:1328 length:354 start_codon:yes stop_codon:yes gene_type:complete